MILVWLIVIPLVGGVLAWAAGRVDDRWPRRVGLAATVGEGLTAGALWVWYFGDGTVADLGGWLVELQVPWIPEIGISLHLAVDGLSLLLVLLTALLGVMAVLASRTEIRERTGFFFFNLLFTLAGITGVFLALDLFLFYFFWELMLVPMFFLIALWGHENRRAAAVKFFIFTQLGGLFLLMAIIGLVFAHGRDTGFYSFDYPDLLGTALDPGTSLLLFLGFFAAFAVKLPIVPLHTWLPDAHTEAPTGGSVILAGLLLKTGAYGLIRFGVPFFPDAVAWFVPIGMPLAVVGIVYGAVLAFSQTDLKRLVAYTSVSHMGFVLLGIAAWNEVALQGAVIQMVCHGVSTGALFMIAGSLQERLGTREIDRLGGLWRTAPRLGAVGLFFALASLGLPGLGNFLGEFLVLLGAYGESVTAAAAAAFGFILATVYALWMVWRAFFGAPRGEGSMRDLSAMEMTAMAILIAVILWIGIFPQPVIDTARQGLYNLGQELPVMATKDFNRPGFQEKWVTGRKARTENAGDGSGEAYGRL